MGSSGKLVLSLFPGVGLLDLAFELEGFCVVRGPDMLWGGDVHRFHPPAGRFDGVIGGPPCQRFSRLASLVRHVYGEEKLAPDLIPDFCRVVDEASPSWFLMENVPAAPIPEIHGYRVHSLLVNNRWVPAEEGSGVGPEQNRIRCFSFGTPGGVRLRVEEACLLNPVTVPAALASGSQWDPRRRRQYGAHGAPAAKQNKEVLAQHIKAQGLPDGWGLPGFTVKAAIHAVGNGVPLPLGRAVAKAVKEAIHGQV